MAGPAEIVAAGAVVSRKGPDVLLVHRPKYDDWSFPKGKLVPGEHVVAAAVREVAEETGLDVRLGPPLPTQRYPVGNGAPRTKDVHYWAARVVGGDDVADYAANREIDAVRWVPLAEAPALLSHARDRATLAEFAALPRGTYPLIVLRHSRARSRPSWEGDDRDRALTAAGLFQAEQLTPLLGAYGVQRVVSSSSRRCWETVTPYAELADLDVELSEELAEETASSASVATEVSRLLRLEEPAVLCTHRPVLPWVFEALALAPRSLEPGGLVVVHHRGTEVVAVEQHDAPFR